MKTFIGKLALSFGCKVAGVKAYIEDDLFTTHTHDFAHESKFQKAYARGIKAAGPSYHFRWRVHIALWAAGVASRLPGDFVECGTNKGFIASAIMEDLDWNTCDKQFYLLDTWQGLDASMLSDEEKKAGFAEHSQKWVKEGVYETDFEAVKRNFSEWGKVSLIKGTIPATLPQITSNQIAFLHLDLNCSPPEVAALEYLWPKLVPGALVLHDDYGGFELSKRGMDQTAGRFGVKFATLPTGQGLLIKPPDRR
jgi:macrocin-O-methyltransferase TylF-like protien